MSKFNPAGHPDVKSSKRSANEIKQEFETTFDQHHKLYNANSDQVPMEEFVNYNAHVSSTIEQDAQFELIMSSVWNMSGNSAASMPFAGSSRKVTAMNAREAYRADHHRNLFGTDTQTPFGKKPQTEWQTTTTGNF